MKARDVRRFLRFSHAAAGTAVLLSAIRLAAQQSPPEKTWTTAEDHQHMMQQLGIKRLRPGPSGNEEAPNHANYDEALANPFPRLPEVLSLRNGRRVTTPAMWWKQRRPEIVEDFEREVVGRVPKNAPKVTWSVTQTVTADVAGRAVVGKRLVGRADNSAFPSIAVEAQLIVVTPSGARAPVPLMIMFRGGGLPGEPPPAGRRGFAPPLGAGAAAKAASSCIDATSAKRSRT